MIKRFSSKSFRILEFKFISSVHFYLQIWHLMFKILSAKDTVILEVITDIESYLSYTWFPRKQVMISV